MKRNYHIISFIIFLLFTSCTETEEIASREGTPLTLQISRENFTPTASTRISLDENFNATFQNRDTIGIIKEYNDGTNKVEQFPYTYNETTGTWEGDVLYYYSTITYKAYYPYNITNDGKTFATILSAWKPQANQSTKENATASIFLGCTCTPNGTKLVANMQPQMAMIIITAKGQQNPDGTYTDTKNLSGKITSDGVEISPYVPSGGNKMQCIIKAATTFSTDISFTVCFNDEALNFPISYKTTHPVSDAVAGKYTQLNLSVK